MPSSEGVQVDLAPVGTIFGHLETDLSKDGRHTSSSKTKKPVCPVPLCRLVLERVGGGASHLWFCLSLNTWINRWRCGSYGNLMPAAASRVAGQTEDVAQTQSG